MTYLAPASALLSRDRQKREERGWRYEVKKIEARLKFKNRSVAKCIKEMTCWCVWWILKEYRKCSCKLYICATGTVC